MKRLAFSGIAAFGLVISACGGSDDTPDGPLISQSGYYTMMRDQGLDFSDEGLDNIGEALCSDVQNLVDEDEDEDLIILATTTLTSEHTSNELEAMSSVILIVARHCPSLIHIWDDIAKDVYGDDLPWN